MYQSKYTYISAEQKVYDLINQNHNLLLMLQHFRMSYTVANKTVEQLCTEHGVNLKAFIAIGNLFNGYELDGSELKTKDELAAILYFLKNSHSYYKEDKYPEIQYYLSNLKDTHQERDFKLIVQFFNEYFAEVVEHLNYEEEYAFPYFSSLLGIEEASSETTFSVQDYATHHTDIEAKLNDLKSLFLKHIYVEESYTPRRKFLTSIFELEFDLRIHSIIEEKILVPAIGIIEAQK